MKKLMVVLPVLLAFGALVGWSALRLYTPSKSAGVDLDLPTTLVKRGDVSFTVFAKGDLQGGNTEVLACPQVGGQALAITSLRESGDLVQPGDVVVQFDTTEQEFRLREAHADLAEAEQQVIQAEAESRAKEEEARNALLQARSELKVAEFETRRNEVLPRIVAKQNELAVEAARDKVRQLERDLADRIATAKAGIAIQHAAKEKAEVASATARRNIDSMTLKAKTAGYVARLQNTEGNTRWGTYLPALQVGDTVRAGVPVAQIPDMQNWEASANITELDRAHLAVGQPVEITVIALPGRLFHGQIKAIGGTSGPIWNRSFECRVSIDDPVAELRPGMSARFLITTEVKKNVLWLPSQALFEADGRKFVYARNAAGFAPHDVKLVRRSESKVVVEGLAEGQLVALANPDQMRKEAAGKTGALQAIPR
ncbi:MAG TPA: efflux RND transporter periplasmic adaptor subunit [Bryobacteraceae bacterium]|nr:efflux RND transporter periplasmic adaptor subunit [Bryobacteraceae bacterium]